MTGLIILVFIPFIVAIGFIIRLRGERKERAAIEERMRILEQQSERDILQHREWYGALTHELRSPLAAVLGYAELLEDGALGDIDDRGRDAIRRIHAAADHVLQLVEGIEGMTFAGQQQPAGVAHTELQTLLQQAADALQFDADARATTLRVIDTNAAIETSVDDAARAVALALGAAIKVSPGTTLVLAAAPDGATVTIAGTRLDPQRDDPDNASAANRGHALTGAAFRLALARHAARVRGGDLSLDRTGTDTTISIRLGN